MVGQTKILNIINNISISTLPRTLMLIGPTGSGRHTLCGLIATHINLELKDITNELSLETINDIYMYPIPRIYVIDMDKVIISNKAQKDENTILKLLEEPLKNAYIILICEQPSSVLPTVLNRCIQWKLAHYSLEDLQKFTLNENILKIANTPGQIISLSQTNQIDSDSDMIKEILDYCDLIIKKIDVASPSNALAICNKISCDSKTVEKGKYPLDIFMKSLLYSLSQYCLDETNQNGFSMYILAKETAAALKTAYVDRAQILSRFILQLREAKRGNI